MSGELHHESEPAWWETRRVAPEGFHFGGLCRSCAVDQHDEHYGQDRCAVDGCTCDEGADL